MSDGIKINQLPSLPGTFDGSEFFPMSRSGGTYKGTIGDLSTWLVASLGINRPPTTIPYTAITDDTGSQLTGNILASASDPDSDPIAIQTFSYGGVAEPFNDGSFRTTYGIMFLNGVTGDWTYTLGAAARALTTGDVAHEVFTYTLADGKGGLATSTLTITINGTNSAPVVSSVNNFTPVNTTVTGNVLTHLAFDYESPTPTILHYVIDGVSGTWAAGTNTTIPSVGTIEIDSTGDYTFVPVTNFIGPVPAITYTVTDGVNNVPAFLSLAVTPLVPGTQPIVIQIDTESCPITGGENNQGGYLSILGFRFGLSGGFGTTTKVYIGGQEVYGYRVLEDARIASKFPGMQHIRVQVGNLGGVLNLGEPYPITVVVSGQASNANFTFTPNPGRIIFASLSGSDLTGTPGDITKPYRHLQLDDAPAGPGRGTGGIYPILRAGDQVVIRGGNWSDAGFNTAWFRFRDPLQQGSVPTGGAGTGWIGFVGYPGEDVHYTTAHGNKGGFQGPGSAFEGTCGDWTYFSNLHLDVNSGGGAQSDGAPINLQSMSERARIVNCELGPWPAGDSAFLNAACVTGQGNRVTISCNYLHDIEATADQQNHGIYGGTSAYGWDINFNWILNCIGGSGIQFNDSEGGTNTKPTQFGVWTGFTNMTIHHNWIENTAKYGLTFSDVGAYQGDLSFRAWNNIFIKTGLAPMRLNTTTATSDGCYAFNTAYNCNTNASGTGNAMFRNEGVQTLPLHNIRAYDNILALGPDTAVGTGWFYDYSGSGSGYDLQRNVYWANGATVSAPVDALAIFGDPLFTNPTTGDFSLQSGSPAANAGTKALPTDMNVYDDITGLASRLFGGAPDCGCYEIGQVTPYNIGPPSASGGPKVGASTSCTVGTWGNSPTSYSRQFTVNNVNKGSAVSGTGSASYTPVAGDERLTLRCAVTATNGSGSITYTVTVGTVAVGVGAPVASVPPAITGTAQSGNTLTCSTGTWSTSVGTISGYSYQWLRNGVAVSGATSSTYALGSPDVGFPMSCVVEANNATTGGQIATTTPTSNVLPAAADPTFVQVIQGTLPTSGDQTFSMGSDVSGGNALLTFMSGWDQHAYNFSLHDTQGHTSSGSSWSRLGDIAETSTGNPSAEWATVASNASGAYTQTINTNVSQGGCAFILEITGNDPASLMDVSASTASGVGTAIAITSGTANTKGNDLVYVGVAFRGAAHTFTDIPSGWTQRGTTQSGGFHTTAVFERKCSSIETTSFTLTADSSDGWLATMIVLKGST